jgi:hypothetical protein
MLKLLLRWAVRLLVIGLALYFIWYFNRPLPPPVAKTPIFEGITYQREIRREPRLAIVHIVSIDLDAPGVHFLVTPRDDIEGFVYRARTTSQFLQEYGLQMAVNGDFFNPWRDYGPQDYYPHEGDGVDVRGLTISQSRLVTEGYAPPENYATLYITPDNQVYFEEPEGQIDSAISGFMMLRDGVYSAEWGDDAYLQQPHPRTVIALDRTGRELILIVVDGRQPNYSDGATLTELADIIREHGGYHALNLDGGGSSTLVMQAADSQAVQLGSAIHTRIPARERPIANHFGIYANSLQ